MVYIDSNKAITENLRVFVYGTLKPGEENYQAYCDKKIKHTERAFTFGTLYDLPAGYPAMTWGKNPVYGYVYEFADIAVLNQLDELEDCDPAAPSSQNLYNRYKIEVFRFQTNPSNQVGVSDSLGCTWAYFMDYQRILELGGTLLPDGWWSGSKLTMKNYQ